jgi:hypothetical protein
VSLGPERCDETGARLSLAAEVRPVGDARVADPYLLQVVGPR